MTRSRSMPSTGWTRYVQVQIDAAFCASKVAGGLARAASLTPERWQEIGRAAAVARWTGEGRRNKYRAEPTWFQSIQGFRIRAASKSEALDYAALDLLIAGNQVTRWVPQVSFLLQGGSRYRCDALVFWADGRVTVRDCKGIETPTFKIKRGLMRSTYGLEIELMKKGGAT